MPFPFGVVGGQSGVEVWTVRGFALLPTPAVWLKPLCLEKAPHPHKRFAW